MVRHTPRYDTNFGVLNVSSSQAWENEPVHFSPAFANFSPTRVRLRLSTAIVTVIMLITNTTSKSVLNIELIFYLRKLKFVCERSTEVLRVLECKKFWFELERAAPCFSICSQKPIQFCSSLRNRCVCLFFLMMNDKSLISYARKCGRHNKNLIHHHTERRCIFVGVWDIYRKHQQNIFYLVSVQNQL